MLVNDVSLRNLIPGELAKGFGFLQGKGQTAFSPVAVTPDELGAAFDGKKVHLPLLSQINGKPFGRPNAGVDMTFDFPTLIAHAVKTRPLMGGAIIGSGTVSNRDADGGPGKPVPDGGVGYSCLAEIRTVETILHGAPKTPYLNFGDRVRIEMNDAQGPLDLRRHRPGGGARLRWAAPHHQVKVTPHCTPTRWVRACPCVSVRAADRRSTSGPRSRGKRHVTLLHSGARQSVREV